MRTTTNKLLWSTASFTGSANSGAQASRDAKTTPNPSSPCLKSPDREENIVLRKCSYLQSGHGHGNAQAPSATRTAVVSGRVGRGARTPVLPAAESGSGGSRLRSVLRESVPAVLPRAAGPTVVAAGDVLPVDADRLLRGDRQRARHRLAGGRFLEFAAVFADWAG